MNELTRKIKQLVLDCGFDKVGIAKAGPLPQDKLQHWLDKKYNGQMAYMENYFEKRTDPTKLVDGAKSVISVAKNYFTPFQQKKHPSIAQISRYAWGDDYHDVLRPRLKSILEKIQELTPGTTGRVFVDSAPIMDKMWAVKAGLGWQGKHSNVITREIGSWIFLGEIVIDLELAYDEPIANYCGTCTRCIDACPTNAIVEPYVVDSSRCISYLTIELKPDFDIPVELAPEIANHVFGCDICQDVCPWNIKFARPTDEKAFLPRKQNMDFPLSQMATMPEEEFKTRFKKSPLKRPKHAGFLRNVKNALKNV